MNNKFNMKRKGKASPKKAGIQKILGGTCLAETEISKLTMIM